MKKKIILHIGTEKTGTTSIQEFCYQNQARFEEHGYYFLQSAGNRNNRALAAYSMSLNKIDDFFLDRGIDQADKKEAFYKEFLNRFTREMESLSDSIHTVIVSSEHFHSRVNSLEEIGRLKKLLDEYFTEYKIICYLREQAQVCESLYSTGIKSGQTKSFNEAQNSCVPENIYYDYYKMLGLWESVFGESCIKVALFEKDKLHNKNLLEDFLYRIDSRLDFSSFEPVNVENESLNHFGQILGRVINSLVPKYDNKKSLNNLRVKLINMIGRRLSGKGFQLSKQRYDEIYANFEKSNLKLSKRYFGLDVNVFAKREKVVESVVIEEDYAEILVDLIANLQEVEIKQTIPDKYADFFRDAAVEVEDRDLNKAIEYMEVAREIRPGGPIINRKLVEYKRKLNKG